MACAEGSSRNCIGSAAPAHAEAGSQRLPGRTEDAGVGHLKRLAALPLVFGEAEPVQMLLCHGEWRKHRPKFATV